MQTLTQYTDSELVYNINTYFGNMNIMGNSNRAEIEWNSLPQYKKKRRCELLTSFIKLNWDNIFDDDAYNIKVHLLNVLHNDIQDYTNRWYKTVKLCILASTTTSILKQNNVNKLDLFQIKFNAEELQYNQHYDLKKQLFIHEHQIIEYINNIHCTFNCINNNYYQLSGATNFAFMKKINRLMDNYIEYIGQMYDYDSDTYNEEHCSLIKDCMSTLYVTKQNNKYLLFIGCTLNKLFNKDIFREISEYL